MRIADTLDVGSPDTATLRQVDRSWMDWRAVEPELRAVKVAADLPAFTRRSDPKVDGVLRALAKLGSEDGHNDPIATSALCWVLLPGALNLARSMRDLGPEVDDLVAGQLWLAARTYPWQSLHPVAGTVLRETRRAVQAELGIGRGAERADRVWHGAVAIAPDSHAWALVEQDDVSPEVQVLDIFRDGIETGKATNEDCQLVLDLALASGAEPKDGRRSIRSGRSRGGLCGTQALMTVAQAHNVSARTVSRRAGRVLDGLREAAGS